ncbi:PHA-granule associated protein 4 [Cupriavidus sp. WKF15]|uniref:PHA-granule associated protein 4 n=1 Tax=Cupriavidus sp. WKF15 TaxID=3032282 RepID=UPI0023E34507|nr:PHA-granule associated protein 4 [Cupriavidus sp. WKF15]WER50305.1 PHA-granule associated protein 4 [Cupriavidus sp. WKF15]
MTRASAKSRSEALRLLDSTEITTLDLQYESGWQDAIELARLGDQVGIRVAYRGHESIAVSSRAALIAGLQRPKTTFRQRNLYCQFNLDRLAANALAALEAKASSFGDYILAGHLLREVDAEWTE